MIIVVLNVHLIESVVYVRKILMIVHLIRVSLVSCIYVLLVLLHLAVRCAHIHHDLLLSHFNPNTASTDFL